MPFDWYAKIARPRRARRLPTLAAAGAV